MKAQEIPDHVSQFILDFIDSIEQLHVLLFLQDHPQAWSEEDISQELRSTPTSVKVRLLTLESSGLLKKDDRGLYYFKPRSENLRKTSLDLARLYRVRPHTIAKLIFSPMKKSRPFVDSFVPEK